MEYEACNLNKLDNTLHTAQIHSNEIVKNKIRICGGLACGGKWTLKVNYLLPNFFWMIWRACMWWKMEMLHALDDVDGLHAHLDGIVRYIGYRIFFFWENDIGYWYQLHGRSDDFNYKKIIVIKLCIWQIRLDFIFRHSRLMLVISGIYSPL